MPHLRALLGDAYEVHDFDERGVPNNADHQWRIDETKYWLDLSRQKVSKGKVLVVCGFSNPDEIAELQEGYIVDEARTILLDGDVEIIEQRLRSRNTDPLILKDLERAVGSPDAFIENNTRFVPILREICRKRNCPIIDTTHLVPEDVAKEVAKFVK